ncbi:Damaged DNA binding protein Ddb1 [Schizosaccharomyces pombe]|uniref:DNA damage-binding protein 1 n=1 Tax=Schizosaccharomyces pombe (strain 972 / ATCC 24843) TaxID=284812 RepID=DDB1_SCHPO|nr:damaged DNA-binding protein Ddb1 [Schizosaccharomyces pombe]O13807.1 RecName: Full=DNA damage-binding protein 1; AltName: Full=Damage-specific DNA-binding protein 1 [Schizosaccharomyces pombe 972h-]CAB11219.1 damaged DNA binding protein Ddb1 [Schizosaccharomyces pombe]|eukprot:NP_593580.1 damaged DNA-binding protein Ddb1 [Schizosaccharomyces pombe]
MTYVTYLHKPSSIRNAVFCKFVNASSWNVIVAKVNCLEVYSYENNRLCLITSANIFAKIVNVKAFKPVSSPTDHIIVATDSFRYFTLFWDANDNTVSNGIKIQDCSERSLRESQSGPLLLVDPFQRVICLHVYQGLLTIIPIFKSKKRFMTSHNNPSLHDNFSVRIQELNVVDIAMLYNSSRPSLAVLYKDSKSIVHLSTYKINVREQEIDEDDVVCHDIEEGKLIPSENGGVFVFGEMYVYYISKDIQVSKLLLTYPITAFSPSISNDPETGLDSSIYIVADESGMLYKFKALFTDETVSMELEKLGESSIASCLIALPDNHLFVGSHFNNSVLLQLPSITKNNHKLEILQNFVNIAPISDFIIDDDQTGSSIITCSGAYKDGTLRIIRNSINIENVALIEMEGIKDFFSVSFRANYDNYIFLSLICETRAIIVSPEGVFSANHDLSCEESTIFVSTIYGNSQILQITTKEIRLFDGKKLHSWISPMSITCGSSFADNVCVAVAGGLILFFEGITEVGRYQCDTEVSSLCFTEENVVYVGLWSADIIMLTYCQDGISLTHSLKLTDIPRSIVYSQKYGDDGGTLYVSTNNGYVLMFNFQNGQVIEHSLRRNQLGVAPIILKHFDSKEKNAIFALGEKPQLMYYESDKLVITPLSCTEMLNISSYVNPSLGVNMLYCTNSYISLAKMSEIRSLNVQTVSVKGFPRRICSNSLFYFVLCMQLEESIGTQEQRLLSFLRVYEKNTLSEIAHHKFNEYEMVESIILMNDDKRVVVGTGFNFPDQDAPDSGRLMVFEMTSDNNIEMQAEHKVQGSVNTLVLYKHLIVAGINASVCIFEYEHGTMHVRNSIRTPTYTIDISVNQDEIIAADLMKSITVLQFIDDQLIEVARDYHPLWATSVEILSERKYFVTEADGNAVILLRDNVSPQLSDRKKLRWYKKFYLGELINKTRHCTFIEPQDKSLVTPQLLCATVDGSLMIVGDAGMSNTPLLLQLQDNIRKVIPSFGGLSHKEWKEYRGENETSPSDLIDGSLIESILGLREPILNEIVNGGHEGTKLDISVQDLKSIIENLEKLHP